MINLRAVHPAIWLSKSWLVFAKNGEAFSGAPDDSDVVMNACNLTTINPYASLVVLGRDQGKALSVVGYENPGEYDLRQLDSSKSKTLSSNSRVRTNTVTIALEEILVQDLPFPHGGINE